MPNGETSECSQIKAEMVRTQDSINQLQSQLQSPLLSATQRDNITKTLQTAQNELAALATQYGYNLCTVPAIHAAANGKHFNGHGQ